MLKKIILKNVASYKEHPKKIEFEKKINLLYGLNGAGKTTLSNYLAAPDEIAFSECQMFKDTNDSLYIYNQKFINENFVTKSGLPGIFTLSKDNGDILKDIEEKESRRKYINQEADKKKIEKENLSNDFSQKKQKTLNSIWKIKESYSGGDRVLEFCLKGKMGSKNDLFEHLISISKPEKVGDTIEKLKKEASEILGDAQKLQDLKRIEIDALTSEQELLLEKQIAGNKDSSVSALIESLKNEDWVRQGLGFISKTDFSVTSEAQCPFCQEMTITQKIIESIKGYFDEAYENDIQELKKVLADLQRRIDFLPDENDFIDHKKIETRKDEFLLVYREIKSLLSENKRKVEEKIMSPGTKVTIVSLESKLTELNKIIDDINTLVTIHNTKIDKTEEVMEDIKQRFWSLMRLSYASEIDLFLDEKIKVDEKINEIDKIINGFNSELKTIEDQIVELQKKTVNIDEAILNIGHYLKDMGITHFELVKHEGTNSYKIQREGQATNIYQSLSEGEKTIITFLYFVEQCKGRKNPTEILNKKIIVIDDPVSSLSHMFVFNIGRLIKQEFFESKNYEQVVILTHSLYFFHELVKPKRRDEEVNNQDFFRVYKTSEGSQVVRMNSSEIQNEYQSYWSVIKDNSTPEVLLANCMRNILEHFFGFVQAHESINNIFQKQSLKDNKFQAFLRYMDRGSHSNTTNISDYKEINHDHFREAFRLVFKENGYEHHYSKMIKI